jgi:AcrR family transcriptional regulator
LIWRELSGTVSSVSSGRLSNDPGQLPRGPHGLTRGAVVENQRQRLILAVPAAVRDKGFAALTVEDISVRAGVSRRTFYENYRDAEECFLASYRQHAQELLTVVMAAAAAGGDWQERARFALLAMLRYLAERPDLAHMALIEVLAAGPAALAERDQTAALLSSMIGEEAVAVAPEAPPRLLFEVIAGAIVQLIYTRVLAGESERLEELLPTIMYMVLVAMHGPSSAAVKAGLAPSEPVQG